MALSSLLPLLPASLLFSFVVLLARVQTSEVYHWTFPGSCYRACGQSNFAPTVGTCQHGWLEFNVPFKHKYGYIRDEPANTSWPVFWL